MGGKERKRSSLWFYIRTGQLMDSTIPSNKKSKENPGSIKDTLRYSKDIRRAKGEETAHFQVFDKRDGTILTGYLHFKPRKPLNISI